MLIDRLPVQLNSQYKLIGFSTSHCLQKTCPMTQMCILFVLKPLAKSSRGDIIFDPTLGKVIINITCPTILTKIKRTAIWKWLSMAI